MLLIWQVWFCTKASHRGHGRNWSTEMSSSTVHFFNCIFQIRSRDTDGKFRKWGWGLQMNVPYKYDCLSLLGITLSLLFRSTFFCIVFVTMFMLELSSRCTSGLNFCLGKNAFLSSFTSRSQELAQFCSTWTISCWHSSKKYLLQDGIWVSAYPLVSSANLISFHPSTLETLGYFANAAVEGCDDEKTVYFVRSHLAL